MHTFDEHTFLILKLLCSSAEDFYDDVDFDGVKVFDIE